MRTNEEIYLGYLEVLKAAIVAQYEHTGRKASGQFASAMSTGVTATSMTLYGAEHSVFVERGRTAGNIPPIQAIKKWIEVKQGLPAIFKEKKNQFAYLIARKIAREGTAGSDVLESAIQAFVNDSVPKLVDELGEIYYVRIQNDIVNLIKTFK